MTVFEPSLNKFLRPRNVYVFPYGNFFFREIFEG